MKKTLISFLAFIWFIEFKPYDGLGVIGRFKWWHPLSYIVICITFVALVINHGFNGAMKVWDNPFRWQSGWR